LNNASGSFEIKTVTGDISLTVKSGEVNAVSKSGTIIQEKISKGKSTFFLKTAKGNIMIVKAK